MKCIFHECGLSSSKKQNVFASIRIYINACLSIAILRAPHLCVEETKSQHAKSASVIPNRKEDGAIGSG